MDSITQYISIVETPVEKQERSRAEDAALIVSAGQGDQRAFTILQKKYVGSITALVKRMLRADLEDIEDIVQETFIKAFQAIHAYNHEFAFSTWLYKIASNNCIDFLRKKRLKTLSINQPIETSDGEIEVELPDHDYIPDLAIQQRERKEILQKAIDELPEKFRIVIQLRHEEDLDYQEIADKLQLPLGTVKAHLFRARAMLYNSLKGNAFHFTDEQ